MADPNTGERNSARHVDALNHFRQARRQAHLEQLLGRLSGVSAGLLSYEDVRQKLRGQDTARRSLREVPLAAIVGSVGRYADFTRSFLPLRESDENRWAQVELGMTGLTGLPPIEVYQIGGVFFVQDGNHRVSVARRLGATSIEAYVTEIETKVPLAPHVRPDELILKAETAEFLARTRLDELRPEADLRVTETGRYPEILRHIEMHHQWLSLSPQRSGAPTFEEAAADWYDSVYLPIAEASDRLGILREFPGRTSLDLYVWIMRHREALTAGLTWDVSAEAAARDLAARHSRRPGRRVSRMTGRLLESVVPDALEAGPPSGAWRKSRPEQAEQSLFGDILVPVTGREEHWYALSQALHIAGREGGRVLGLHVVRSQRQLASPEVQAISAEFHRRCAGQEIPVQFAVDVGPVARMICERSWWADLVVVRLIRPPAPERLARLTSGFRTMLRRCGGPLLVVPRSVYALDRLLLAYNGQPKSLEALFLAAYLASRWQKPLTVVAVREQNPDQGALLLSDARRYLESQGVDAAYVAEAGPVVEGIHAAAAAAAADLIIMGGYGQSPLVEIAGDSIVNKMLRSSHLPLLVCR